MMTGFGSKVAHDRLNWVLLLAATLFAMICAALALFIDAAMWAVWFHHPARQPMPDVTNDGARLWRVMLAVTAAAIVAGTVTLVKVNPGGSVSVGSGLSRKRMWMLIGFVAIAIIFRAARLNESLWYDEIASWMTYSAGVNSPGPVIGNFRDPINQVFHTLLNFFSVRWLGEWLNVELAFRIPALLFSLLSVIAMFGVGRAARDERLGLIAAFLAAVLPVSALEGAQARSYSMMICFAALMTWTLIEAKRRQRAWIWIVYSILGALGIWAHFVAAFVPIGHALWITWRAFLHREVKFALSAFIALALGAILSITIYAPMIPDMLSARGMFAAVRPDQPRILSAEGLHALLQLGGSWYWWAAPPGLILFAIGALRLRRKTCDEASVVAASLLGLPLMLIAVMLLGTWVYARFTLFALPGAMLLIALGIDALWRRSPHAGMTAILIVIIASIADLAIRPPKQPLRNAADYVRQHIQPNEHIVIVGLAHPVMRLYINDLNPLYSFMHGKDLEAQLPLSALPEWVIVEYPLHVNQSRYALLEQRGYHNEKTFNGWADWKHGDIIVMRRSAAP